MFRLERPHLALSDASSTLWPRLGKTYILYMIEPAALDFYSPASPSSPTARLLVFFLSLGTRSRLIGRRVFSSLIRLRALFSWVSVFVCSPSLHHYCSSSFLYRKLALDASCNHCHLYYIRQFLYNIHLHIIYSFHIYLRNLQKTTI